MSSQAHRLLHKADTSNAWLYVDPFLPDHCFHCKRETHLIPSLTHLNLFVCEACVDTYQSHYSTREKKLLNSKLRQ